ncbi:hypothetical protein M422DRAFT_261857 [Sphaerobolus stellatus SS14]|uniref:Uncharacterized protein n=1 Tax=Sphaerobolus stellatus (strain SS14) TaxID=990650 RepID=A0A0C9VET5_SPHS4|nr:hypothetical protein M422DRAFT_261857 [Sphaerobolus stellatus SS14]
MYLHNMDVYSILGNYYPEPTNAGNIKEYTLHISGQEARDIPKFKLQGYLTDIKVPHLTNSLPKTLQWSKIRFQVLGFGNEYFTNTILAIHTLQEILHRDIADMSREDWQPSAYDKYPAINLSSSYFAKIRHCTPTELSELIDPCGELALRATAQNLVWHPDFLEEFCEQKIIESNDKTILNYQNINPATIRKGQLVEVCIEIKAILTKRARWKTIIIPSAIVIIRRDIDRAYMKWRLEDTTLRCSRTPLITQCKQV